MTIDETCIEKPFCWKGQNTVPLFSSYDKLIPVCDLVSYPSEIEKNNPEPKKTQQTLHSKSVSTSKWIKDTFLSIFL